jgi:hypothetical protein
MTKNTDVWLCHTSKKIDGKQTIVSCHLKITQKCVLKLPVVPLEVALLPD